MVKALDWHNADEIAARLKAMVPQQAQGGLPPELEQQIQQGQQMIQDQGKELEAANNSVHREIAAVSGANATDVPVIGAIRLL